MSVTVQQRHMSPKTSVSRDSSTERVDYWAAGDTDRAAVYTAAVAVIPSTSGLLILKSIDLDFAGGVFWYVTANYGIADKVDQDEDDPQEEPDEDTELTPDFSFSTSGGTEHITQSLSTLSKTQRGGGAAFDNKKAIGLTKDGVEGVDRVSFKFEFQFTRRRTRTTHGYMKQLADATGSYNFIEFMTYAPRTLLFLGADGKYAGDTSNPAAFDITYKFAYSPNQTDIEICDGLSVDEKPGWHYLWCTYSDEVDGDFLYQRPIAAYVEQVYPAIGFKDALDL